jgi:hypothetical protein
MSLHSAHNPAREAERFADAQQFPQAPLYIVVTEPGESYLAAAFRSRYPDACLVALRYTESDFLDSDGLWDRVWRPGNAQSCYSFLYGLIGDEYLPLSAFVRWKPSDARWPESARSVWEGIRGVFDVQMAIMHTRSHFGRRWLGNILRNAERAERVIDLTLPDKPVFLALSGPSLERQFPFDRSGFFVCSASSALSVLLARGVEPDACFATDGGYWALPLFDGIPARVPVAFPLEAAIPRGVLESNECVVLDYGSALESDILSITGIRATRAERNGSVAGTAASFFVDHSKSGIYAAGLDLAASSPFSHARPHPSLDRVESATGRMTPLCAQLYEREALSASLDTYASWFASRDDAFKSRFFRLEPAVRRIDGIRTVSLGDVDTGGVPPGRRDAIRVRQRIAGTNARIEAIREYVERFRERADRCLRMTGVERKAEFFAGELDVPAGRDMLQMISYTGYVNCLKASRRSVQSGAGAAGAGASPDSRSELGETLDRLCGDARSFAETVLAKAGKR